MVYFYRRRFFDIYAVFGDKSSRIFGDVGRNTAI